MVLNLLLLQPHQRNCVELTSISQWNPHEVRLGKVQTQEHILNVRSVQKVISNINGIDIIHETKAYSDVKKR